MQPCYVDAAAKHHAHVGGWVAASQPILSLDNLLTLVAEAILVHYSICWECTVHAENAENAGNAGNAGNSGNARPLEPTASPGRYWTGSGLLVVVVVLLLLLLVLRRASPTSM